MNDRQKVLVIDDDPMILKTLSFVLKRQGYEYRLADNAVSAIEYADDLGFDVVLADIRMPAMNGVDAIKEIQQKRKEQGKKELPVIFITGYADDGIRLKAEKLGEVIQKPFDLDQLMITMREYL